jgi:hypothetical protein
LTAPSIDQEFDLQWSWVYQGNSIGVCVDHATICLHYAVPTRSEQPQHVSDLALSVFAASICFALAAHVLSAVLQVTVGKPAEALDGLMLVLAEWGTDGLDDIAPTSIATVRCRTRSGACSATWLFGRSHSLLHCCLVAALHVL